MWRNVISVFVAASMLVTTTLGETSRAESKGEKEMKKEAKQAAKIRQEVAKRGTGENARAKVELKNNTKLNGYVSEIGDDTFVITTFKTKAATKVAYRDVARLSGHGLPTGTKVAIIAGVVIALVLVIALVAYPSAASH
jgi:hypothetical protein